MIAAVVTALMALAGWQTALPLDAGWAGEGVNGTFVLGVGGAVVAYDERTGRERWHAGESLAMEPIGTDVVLGQPGGRVVRFDARTGASRWSARVCPATADATAFLLADRSLFVGCSGGRIARVAPDDGRVLAKSDAMHLDAVDVIASAGGCHVNVQAHQSGAILSEQDTIVDCRSLRAVMPQRQEVWFLGVVKNRAVMADQCCGVGGAMDEPAGIFTIDGTSGAATEDRPFVAGEPFLAGSRVCVGQHSQILCRAIGDGGSGTAVVSGLTDFPDRVEPGRIALARSTSNGTIAELNDVTSGRFRRICTTTLPAGGRPDLSGSIAVGTLTGPMVVRRDGKTANIPVGAMLLGTGERLVFVRVTTPRLIGNRYVTELRAIPWQ